MNEQDNDSKQSGYSDSRELQPVEDVLKQQGYSPPVVENYTKLTKRDLHLAELYRLANAPGEPGKVKDIRVNPIQASIDRDGKIVVDVLLELKEGVTVKELSQVMKVHAYIGRFVAGRVLAERAPELIEKATRIETSRPIAPTLDKSVPSIQADQATLANKFPAAFQQESIDGRNVIIGIIDHGCDFKHPNFLKEGKTRLLYLWDQTGSGGPKPAAPFDYGVEFDQASINQALQSQDPSPYNALGYTPEKEAHGTHVMGIAAGSSTEFAGVAPAADLIFVHLGKAANKTGQPLDLAEAELKTFGSSWNLFNAVKYILEKADQLNKGKEVHLIKPVVINISQGANGGPHDGTTMIEQAFDEVLTQKKGRAIVITAGNSREDGIHTSGDVQPGVPNTILWRIDKESLPTSEIRHEVEIWYDLNGALTLRLLDPYGVVKAECHLGKNPLLPVGGGLNWPVMVRNQRPDNQAGEDENLINILVDNRGLNPANEAAPKHIWRLELLPDAAETNIRYHVWIERNDSAQSSLAMDSQPSLTINTIGNAALPIVVGAYDSYDPAFPSLFESGEGPTRNRKISTKPDLSAPGWRIFSANAQTAGDGMTLSGTSMAAPHVSGLIALMFQAARDLKSPPKILDINEIRDILISTADKNPPAGQEYHPRYGFGRINAAEALRKILE
jgi:subtilisin family serine protease